MTRTKQAKAVTTDVVELNDAALDQAGGGGEEIHYTITLTKGVVSGDGSVKSTRRDINDIYI